MYLDESGDLGFRFEETNPSQYLTISILAVSQTCVARRIERAVKLTLRRKVNRKNKRENELKGTKTDLHVKKFFYEQIQDEKFGVYAMTIRKDRVFEELRRTTHERARLYNYLARQVLDKIPFEKADCAVQIIVDKSKNKSEIRDFNQYVVNNLEGRIDPRCRVDVLHRSSAEDKCLSAADLFCWGIFRRHERGDAEWYDVYRSKVRCDERYL